MRTTWKVYVAAILALFMLALPQSEADAGKNRLTIMVFYADWCGVCRALDPTLERAVEDAGNAVQLVEVDVDEHPNLTNQYGVEYVPLVLAIRNGETLDYFTGDASYREIITFIEGALDA